MLSRDWPISSLTKRRIMDEFGAKSINTIRGFHGVSPTRGKYIGGGDRYRYETVLSR